MDISHADITEQHATVTKNKTTSAKVLQQDTATEVSNRFCEESLSLNRVQEVVQDSYQYIKSLQLDSGAIPWFHQGKLDPWDHVEAAMGMCIAGDITSSQNAYRWLIENQNEDGSWFASYFDHTSEHNVEHDPTKIETNFVAYFATGLWHYYQITQDQAFIQHCYPALKSAIDFVVRLQRSEGDIQWASSSKENLPEDALITACASILRSLECAVRIASLLGESTNCWLNAYLKLADALKNKPWRFDRTWESKARYSMDWFYPVLSGIYTREEINIRLNSRWNEFVEPAYGCRCVSDEPWMTVAESCELTLALIASGRAEQAKSFYHRLLQWQDADGGFWTGYSFRDHAIWPKEKTTWTAAAIILAADALFDLTPASTLFTEKSILL